MRSTDDLRQKLLKFWSAFERGEVSTQDARIHIGFSRAVLDSLKVEIAAAHLNESNIPAVPLSGDIDVRSVSLRPNGAGGRQRKIRATTS